MFARTAACLSCLLLCSVEPQLAYADGKLARARREAASSSDDDERGHGGERGHDDHHHSRSFVESLLCGLFSCDDDDHHHHHHHHDSEVALSVGADEVAREPAQAYAPYPYASPLAPYLLDAELQVASTSSALDVQLHREHVAGRPFAGQLSFDGGYLGGVAHSGMDARLLTPSPFELGARTTLLYEPSARDYSLFGAAEVGLRFASLRVLSVRAIVGPAWFGKPSEMLYGVELGLGLDVYLGRPLGAVGAGQRCDARRPALPAGTPPTGVPVRACGSVCRLRIPARRVGRLEHATVWHSDLAMTTLAGKPRSLQ